MNIYIKILLLNFLVFIGLACQNDDSKVNSKLKSTTVKKERFKLFDKVPADSSNIHFSNNIGENSKVNYLYYQYMYNGGGVGIGDFNNDGLKDIFFCGNDVNNALYINQGNFKFKDISSTAGILDQKKWGIGVCLVDINNDNYLDIYVSNGGNSLGETKRNSLFVNNGDLTFTESALEYGIADTGWTNQSAFFDYDNDGDLDLYVMNHPNEWIKESQITQYGALGRLTQDRLYKNVNGKFTDASYEAGLLSQDLGGYGLGLTIADVDLNGFPDIYISGDFESPDLLYMNQGNGTFKEEIKKRTGHISYYSMGVDINDFNNDGLFDIMTLDMAAEDHTRIKTQMSGMNPEKFNNFLKMGLPHQYMYNMLHKNNGNGHFSEIGHFSGVQSTDWSWGPLFADLDNDGLKDIIISNGNRFDLADNDFLKDVRYEMVDPEKLSYEEKLIVINQAPVTPMANYAYQNQGNYKFEKTTYEWGLNEKGFSQGIAYSDLDNDGDLDLIMNNIDSKAWVYKNNAEQLNKNYLKIDLKEPYSKTIGAIIKITTSDSFQVQHVQPCRGYLSSVDNSVHFGLSNHNDDVNIEVYWPDGSKSEVTSGVNKKVLISKSTADKKESYGIQYTSLFKNLEDKELDFEHKENEFDDFKNELLLPHKMSQLGPALASGDINNDGLLDLFIGGAHQQSGAAYIQMENGAFTKINNPQFGTDKIHEDVGALFFDYDQDGDQDLYVVSGSNEFKVGPNYQDRLYNNNGKGVFSKTKGIIPEFYNSGQSISAGHFINDQQLDLFIGGRQTPGKYPSPPKSHLLIYSDGVFKDKTLELAPELENVGMVTSSQWVDIDNDKDNDLIVVGEWMAITIFINENGKLEKLQNDLLADNVGWWSGISANDFDNDGDIDFLIGNLGLNYKYKASKTEPFQIWQHDFDNNGSLDIVLGYYDHGICFPVRGRQCSSEQMPFIKKKFPSYNDFANADIEDIYGPQLKSALNYKATNFASVYLENLGNYNFKFTDLPNQVQFSKVNSIVTSDFNNDGVFDAILVGNHYESEVETPRADASIGNYLTFNLKTKSWEYQEFEDCGLDIPGNSRNAVIMGQKEKNKVVISKNNSRPQIVNVSR